MKTNPHKYRPLFHSTVKLNTEAAYQNFFKKRPTLVHALEAKPIANENMKLGKHYIIKSGKYLKLLLKLSFHYRTYQRWKICSLSWNLKPTDLLEISKHFRNIKSLILSDFSKNHINWLKGIRQLKALKCISADSLHPTNVKLYNKFYRYIKMKKIPEIILEHFHDLILRPFSKYSSYTEKLSLYSGSILSPISNDFTETSLAHLYKLKSLALYWYESISIPRLTCMLTSLPQPSKLTCLNLCINNRETLADIQVIYQSFISILKTLNNLQRIEFYFEAPLSNFKAFEIMKNYPLQYFALSIPITKEEEMIIIGNFIGSLSKLIFLKLTLTGTILDCKAENSKLLFDQISQCKDLKELDLYINTSFQFKTSSNSYSKNVLSSFSDCLSKLHKLKAIKFKHPRINIYNEFRGLVQALKEKTSILTRLEFDFQDPLPKGEALKFCDLIENMSSLESLIWSGLVFETPKHFERFIKILSTLKKLKVLELRELKGKTTKELFLGVINQIIGRKIKLLYVNSSLLTLTGEITEAIDVEKIHKENPDIEIYLPQIVQKANTGMFPWM